jgi:hypothetical protein
MAIVVDAQGHIFVGGQASIASATDMTQRSVVYRLPP